MIQEHAINERHGFSRCLVGVNRYHLYVFPRREPELQWPSPACPPRPRCEYWKSVPMWRCPYCKCNIQDTKAVRPLVAHSVGCEGSGARPTATERVVVVGAHGGNRPFFKAVLPLWVPPGGRQENLGEMPYDFLF